MVHYEQLVKRGFKLPIAGEVLCQSRGIFSLFPDFVKWATSQGWRLDPESEYAWNMFVISRYLAEGERVFRIEPGLTRLLLDTDVPKVTGDHLRLPFPTLYLEFPGKFFHLPNFDQPFIGCYLYDVRPTVPYISADLVIEPRVGELGLWDFCVHINIDVPKDKPVNWGNLFAIFVRALAPEGHSFSKEQQTFLQTVAAFTSELMPFIVNAILYATSASPDVSQRIIEWRERDLPKKLRGKGFGLPKSHKYFVGSSIRVQYGAPRATQTKDEERGHRRVLKRFLVRGHWHWYRHGPGRTQLTHKFVAPYWKGPKDLAELLGRKYRIS